MAKNFTDEDDALLAELGVDVETKSASARTPREERIIAGFEEIQRFFEEHGRAPQHGEDRDIFERLYAKEELVAELGAACLSADLGLKLEDRQDHVAYIGSWLKVLRDDKRAIFAAAAHAQRAADFLHQLQPAVQLEAAE